MCVVGVGWCGGVGVCLVLGGVVCGVFCFVWLVLGGVWWCGVLFCFGWCVCVVCFVLGGGVGVGFVGGGDVVVWGGWCFV